MPEYSQEQVAPFTEFLRSLFVGNINNVVVAFNADASSSSNANNNPNISLFYTITIEGYVFSWYIHYFRVSGVIKLISNGNGDIPFEKMLGLNSNFMIPFLSFERRKENYILPAFQDLPINVR